MLEKGEIMAEVEYATSSYKTPLHHRIIASMPVKASWIDAESGETVNVEGMTENVGETSALVNLETLPPVGSEVRLRIMEENKTIIEVLTQVIRVERDSQKGIVIGHKGENLKRAGTGARLELERLLGVRIHLETHVRVDPDWQRKAHSLDRLGY